MRLAVPTLIALLSLGLAFVIYQNVNKPKVNQPPIVEVDSFDMDSILRTHKNVIAIKGTGSMRPLIPASDNPEEIVAWAVVDSSKDFATLHSGQIVVFRHKDAGFLIHELSLLDKDGWISSGAYNKFYDSGRVTRENLRGVVTSIYKPRK